MLILSSNGITSEALHNKIRELLVKDTGFAALIPTASEYKENDWNVPKHKEALERLGLNAEIFDIETQNPTLLEKYDVLLLGGGNPLLLLDIMRKLNCKPLFEKYIKTKLVIGVSAGSIVFGETLAVVNEFTPEENDSVGLNDFTGLSLTDINVCPHFSRFEKSFDRWNERIDELEKRGGFNVTRINDGQAVFVNGDNSVII